MDENDEAYVYYLQEAVKRLEAALRGIEAEYQSNDDPWKALENIVTIARRALEGK